MANFKVSKSTKKLCPFATFQFGGAAGGGGMAEGQPCVKDACQLWVPQDEGKHSESDPFQQNNGTKSIGTQTNDINSEDDMGRCGAQVSDFAEMMFKLQHHLHKHHEHPLGHRYEHVPPQPGSNFTPFGYNMPDVQSLSMEYSMQEDMDGDGKIYGRDFSINNSNEKPFMLRNLDNANVYNTPHHRVDWDDYNNGKFPPMFNTIYPNIGHNNGGHRVRIHGGFFFDKVNYVKFYTEDQPNDPILEITDIDIIKGTGDEQKDGRYIYLDIPAGAFSGYEGFIDIEIKTSGNTFDVEGIRWFQSIDTGGRRRFNRVYRVKTLTTEELDAIESIIDGDVSGMYYTVDFNVNQNGYLNQPGTTLNTGNYFLNSTITSPTVYSNPGYRFIKWDDNIKDNPRDVKVTGHLDFEAIIELGYYEKIFTVVKTINEAYETTPGDSNYYAGKLKLLSINDKDMNDVLSERTINEETWESSIIHIDIELLESMDEITVQAIPVEQEVYLGEDTEGVPIVEIRQFKFIRWSDGDQSDIKTVKIEVYDTTPIYPIFDIV